MTPPPVTAEPVEPAEAEIELDDTDGVLDLTDRRRVLLQVVFGVDVPATVTDEVFTPPATGTPSSSL
ncbi:hypothetical protein [Actinospongicola halichondriae]|uniref:hypothetical protein n=1 Tax=Actinospongicola halichondriae TaxID=3236844 RepID=UPI003D4FB68E